MTPLSSSQAFRVAVLSLSVSLLIVLLPSTAVPIVAQDAAIAVSGAFEEEGDSGEADVL